MKDFLVGNGEVKPDGMGAGDPIFIVGVTRDLKVSPLFSVLDLFGVVKSIGCADIFTLQPLLSH